MQKMTKADELFLKGDLIGFWKLMLKQVRSARTQAKNILAQLDLASKKWPNRGEEEREKMRQELDEAIIVANRQEERALIELGKAVEDEN